LAKNQLRSRIVIFFSIIFGFLMAMYFFSRPILLFLGKVIVFDEKPIVSDAVVVLETGVEYYPRLIEAADLYRKGYAKKIVINGNRKTDVIRDLEKKGFKSCCPWYENSLRMLSLFGIPRENILCISAEDAYDTVSEAKAVGEEILQRGFSRIILTTSKSHTRRAHFIWSKMYGDRLTIYSVSAKTDPYNPKGWWKDGRQIRWVLSEYGAWVYYWWKINKNGLN
jgi:uncharacterized SAM-binding protein YcdF (DUF218 family)